MLLWSLNQSTNIVATNGVQFRQGFPIKSSQTTNIESENSKNWVLRKVDKNSCLILYTYFDSVAHV